MAEPIPLAAFIQQLRRELQTAIAEGEGQSPRFEVQDLEIEVQVVAAHDVSGKSGGGLKLNLGILSADVSGEMGGKVSSSQVQRVKLKLRPVGADRKTVDLAG